MLLIEYQQPASAKERDLAIGEAIKDIEKEHGKGSIRLMGDTPVPDVEHVAIGLYPVDHYVLGIGGLPRGRIIEIYGPEASGKTSLALTAVGAVQRQGGVAAYIDAEHALDPKWMSLLGVDVGSLLISQPDYGEQALQIVQRLLESKAVQIIVIDSVAALVPKAELDGEIGDANMGMQARMMSQTLRMLSGLVYKTGCIVIFINQLRDKIGVMFGSPEVTTGGKSLKFYSSVRLDVRRIAGIKEGDTLVGNRVKIKGAKNKCSTPFRECEVDLLFDRGFDRYGALLDAAVESKVVEKAGSWYSFNGERIGQGKSNAVAFLTERGLYDTIEGLIHT
jgi:recombination protein RecA